MKPHDEKNFVAPVASHEVIRPQPDPISGKAIVGTVEDLLKVYDRQQRDAGRAYRDDNRKAVGGYHSTTSTAAEIAENRRTLQWLLGAVIASIIATVGGIIRIFQLAVTIDSELLTSGHAWFAGFIFLTGLVGMMYIHKTFKEAQRHTPEGLAHEAEANDHEIRLLETEMQASIVEAHAEAMRMDIELRRAALRRQELEADAYSMQLEERRRAIEVNAQEMAQPQSENNRLLSYENESTADHEKLRMEIVYFVCDESNYDLETGRIEKRAPWAKASNELTAEEKAIAVDFLHSIELFAGHRVFYQAEKGKRWHLDIEKNPDFDQLFETMRTAPLRVPH